MITQATYNLSVSYLKSQLGKIRQSENLHYLWDIALELNSNKVLSNAKLQIISNHLYNLKQRRNSKRLATVKEMLISSIQKSIQKGGDNMKIVNLTPHSITFFDAAGNAVLTVEPSGQIARCSVAREKIGDINGIPVNKSKFGEVENLPEPEEGTIYVVSALTAQAVPDRPDVFIVDDAVRDEQGRIIGARALAHI